jgi:2'-5' RNA ligase
LDTTGDLQKSHDDGVMVALDVPEAVAHDLQRAVADLLPEGAEMLPVGEMHITLFYPGEINTLQKEAVAFTQDQLLNACKEFARTHAPLVGVIGGVARFNTDGGDKNPIVALFDCAELPQFRQDLVEHLHAAGIHEADLDENHGFIPHITLAYVPVDASMKDELKIDSIPLSFTEITAVWGGQWHYMPLQAKQNFQ